ncbi:response regulator [bacterium]|nr:response regulator [bacterium]
MEKAKNGRAGRAGAAVPLALLFAAIVIASFAIFSRRVGESETALCRGVAHNASEEAASFLAAVVDSGSPLASALAEDPALPKGGIAAMAKAVLDARPYVVGVSVAPSAIVKYHFPEEGNESLIGHDLLSNPERRDALTSAAERKVPVLSGPFESVDGKRVLFVRYPVFASGKLWGFTSLTVDFKAMAESLALEKRFPGFSFALAGQDYLAGARKAFADSRAVAPVALPGADWSLHAVPAAGWSAQDPFLVILLVAGITGALLLFAALRRGRTAPAQARVATLAAAPAQAPVPGKETSALDWLKEASLFEVDAPAAPAPNPVAEPEAPASGTRERGAAYGLGVAKASAAEMLPPGSGIPPEPAAEAAAARKSREIKFIGPDVRGEVYMPEILVSGEPGSLFARFASETRGEPAAAPAASPKASPSPEPAAVPPAGPMPDSAQAAGPVQAKPSHREPAPAPQPQKEFPFTLEEPAAAKLCEAKKAPPAILVVDDSEANREIMGRMLALRGYQADFAVSGEEALERCSRRSYDIVFMDCFMPGMDGYKASTALRGKAADRVRTIVGMSARIGDQEVERCRQAGMDDLLAKPFTLKQLLAHLERL